MPQTLHVLNEELLNDTPPRFGEQRAMHGYAAPHTRALLLAMQFDPAASSPGETPQGLIPESEHSARQTAALEPSAALAYECGAGAFGFGLIAVDAAAVVEYDYVHHYRFGLTAWRRQPRAATWARCCCSV